VKLTLKIAALIFSLFHFLGYGWWDREYMSLAESIYWLLPAFSLLVIAVIPFQLMALVAPVKLGVSILFVGGALRLFHAAIASWNSPIEPDTPAIFLQLISLVILAVSGYIIWSPELRKSERA
jgi:hypothetical protein